jgi:hypothetical protein
MIQDTPSLRAASVDSTSQDAGLPVTGPSCFLINLFRLVLCLIIFGYVIFAHGCHRDVDDELLLSAGESKIVVGCHASR